MLGGFGGLAVGGWTNLVGGVQFVENDKIIVLWSLGYTWDAESVYELLIFLSFFFLHLMPVENDLIEHVEVRQPPEILLMNSYCS